MAIQVRKQAEPMLYALISAHNAFKRDVAANLTTEPHADISSLASTGDYLAPVVGAPDIDNTAAASDLATSITRANSLKAVYNRHIADADAHKNADATNVVSAADATDLASVEALLNAIKTAYGAHRTQATRHFTNDTANLVTAANATDLASSQTLANDLHTQINAHIQAGFTSPSIKLVGP